MSEALTRSLERLYALRTHGIKPGLHTVQSLLAKVGDPHLAVAAIHVAGTNGKGSVCAILAAILQSAGYTVGMYTSPHLLRFNERIRINGAAITDEELAALFAAMEPAAEAVARETGNPVTFFEFTTVLAFEYFRRKGVKLVVLETGLGGRLDATNVVLPVLSVITRIGIDHAQYLGDTIELIAAEKAGIIKSGRPVIAGAMPDAARAVVERQAAACRAPLVIASEQVSVVPAHLALDGMHVRISSRDMEYGSAALSLTGGFQAENIATAVAAVEVLGGIPPFRIPPEAVVAGLKAVTWPGRLQLLSDNPPILLDGAHNPDAATALATSMRKLVHRRPVGLVCGMCADKDVKGTLSAFAALVSQAWFVELQTGRAADPETLARIGHGLSWKVETASLPVALAAARAWATANDGVVLIAGSLYLVGEVMEAMGMGNRHGGW